MSGPLTGLRVLNLSRILAEPTCTQLLADLGADVIKVENPITNGDDTRVCGPPFTKEHDGFDSDLSAYFICANRNKRSLAVDLSSHEGQDIIRKLAKKSDVLVENFKSGALKNTGWITTACPRSHHNLSTARSQGSGKPDRTQTSPDMT